VIRMNPFLVAEERLTPLTLRSNCCFCKVQVVVVADMGPEDMLALKRFLLLLAILDYSFVVVDRCRAVQVVEFVVEEVGMVQDVAPEDYIPVAGRNSGSI
jgi:hypothetical protein